MAYVKYLEIATSANGTYTDVTKLIALGGYKVTRNDIDASGSGRSTVTGEMYRGRVGKKQRIDCECKPLTQTQSAQILSLIEPEYVYVNYLDPQAGWRTGVKMYSNNVPATSLFVRNDEAMWAGITFPLIEV